MTKTKIQILALLLSLLLPFTVEAQKTDWGTIQEADSKWFKPHILGENEKAFFTTHFHKKKFHLSKYDKADKKLQYTKTIELPDKKWLDISKIEQISYVEGKFIILFSEYKKDEKTNSLYLYSIDSETGENKGEVIQIFNVQVDGRWSRGNFYVHTSIDKKRILLNHYAYYKEDKAWKDKFVLLDSDLNVLLEKENTVEKGEIDYSTANWIIDKEGSVYYIKSFSESEKYIVTYDALKDYEKWEERVDLSKYDSEAVISQLNFSINDNSDLIVTGYYIKKAKGLKVLISKGEIKGVFFLRIDHNSKEIVVNKISEFSDEVKNDFRTERQVRKEKPGKIENYFNSIQIIKKEDGGILQIGEMYRHVIHKDRNGKIVGETEYYMDLLVVNLSPEGEIIWTKRVPKFQYFSVTYGLILSYGSFGVRFFKWNFDIPEFFSYVAVLDENKLNILFNDNPKNSLAPTINTKRKRLKKLKKSVVMKHTFELTSGEQSSEIYYDIKVHDVFFMPMQTYQQKQNTDPIIFAKNKKNYKFGIIDLKE